MKKIGIVTIIDNNNYGNRLQNYAVSETLKKLNFSVYTIKNRKISFYLYYKNSIKQFLKRVLKKNYRMRYHNFIKFNKNIKFNNYMYYNKTKPSKLSKKYDFFISGSDQIWNPFFERLGNFDLLSFTEHKKRISFSASFGISELPPQYKGIAKKELKKFKSISVRENTGREIVRDLIGKEDVEVLVDPTMLLTDEEWDKVAVRPKQLDNIKNSKYILNYFLGELSESRRKEIERIAQENDCHIINILDKKDPFYSTGPSEFLYLEKNAFLICTDSFHSTVFAILYGTPFIVFDREDNKEKMNSRLDTLLSKFKLESRKYNCRIDNELLKCDYTGAYKILDEERKKSVKFLKKALDIKD